ncbi:MAG: SDR family NAD(P)-dependent oxidoreductase [Anaerolineaceae bacterium]|nr:SDR family NAD(P)-dependent oxidoreductase [Anaerolineaceae bacterium]
MKQKYLVTGGAGFIGSNYVSRLIQRGESVVVYDNLSRDGAKLNLRWLNDTYGTEAFTLIQADVRDADVIREAAKDVDVIVHLAAQVAVTTSVTDPRNDFEINALGTFNVLEAARASGRFPAVLYASTNKVYGGMEEVKVVERESDYAYADFPRGMSEAQPLDFHSPYGCSKGTGDQYVRDYARIYDLPTVVLRQSCIYGPRQFGIEDQGWVAWFIIAALTGKKITIYGDGKQVRDILFVEDLLDAYDAAIERIDQVKGMVYNIGGGAENTMSVWAEFGPLLEDLLGRKLVVAWGDWRPGDQRIYVSDISRAQRELGWTPKHDVPGGLRRLFEWASANQALFS